MHEIKKLLYELSNLIDITDGLNTFQFTGWESMVTKNEIEISILKSKIVKLVNNL